MGNIALQLLAAADETARLPTVEIFLHGLLTFLTLTAMETALSLENVAFAGFKVARLDVSLQRRANTLGFIVAGVTRIGLLVSAVVLLWLLNHEIVWGIKGKDVALFVGGLFLFIQVIKEIYVTSEHPEIAHKQIHGGKQATFKGVMWEIFWINLIFSLDSVLTAVGMSRNILVMSLAIIASVLISWRFSEYFINALRKHTSVKILALVFVFMVSVFLCCEGVHYEIRKSVIYISAFVAAVVVGLTIRSENNKQRFEDSLRQQTSQQ
jgi:predicted tellurium resistance membrane protein TerC